MPGFDNNTLGFNNWLKSNYTYLSPKFVIKDLRSEDQGRGLIATQDIKKDETIFELSRDSIINIDTATLTKLQPNNKNILMSLNQWQALILCLSYEIFLNKKSKWFSYFNVLPLTSEDFDSLMYWKDEDLEYLKPSTVLFRIGKKEAEELYHKLVPKYCDKLGCKELSDFLSLEKFHIIASLIMSYSFDVDHPEEVEAMEKEEEEEEDDDDDDDDGGGDDGGDDGDDGDDDKVNIEGNELENYEEDDENNCSDQELEADPVFQDTYLKSMVPLADTLNSNTTLFNATLNYEQTRLVMKAKKDIKEGQQIFNIYGELPNSEILRKYGYVELPKSNFEFAEIPSELIISFFKERFRDEFKFLREEQSIKLVDYVFKTIQNSEYLDEALIDVDSGIVLERYEIYSNGEILPELLLLLLITSTIFAAFKSDLKWLKKLTRGVERRASLDLENFVNRSILKCHQLLEENAILTHGSVDTLKELVKRRILEYPINIVNGSFKLPESYFDFSKKQLAEIVLKNEVDCFQDVLSDKFPPKDEDGEPKFKIVEDEKLLRNLLKRKLEGEKTKANKRQKK